MNGHERRPRRAVADDALGTLDVDRRDLGRVLDQWAARDDRPADAVLGVLDGMVAGLRELRARLAARPGAP